MITERQYSQLCRECDSILLDQEATKAIIANVGLHIIREHPNFLNGYRSVFEASRLAFVKEYSLVLLRSTSISLVRIVSSLFSRGGWYCKSKIPSSDVLFISHLINEKLFDSENDFYFHDMPKKLNAAGYSSSVVMINHIKAGKIPNTSLCDKRDVQVIILSTVLDFISELKIYAKQWRSLIKLKTILRKTTSSLRLNVKTLIFSLASDTANTIRIATQISRLVQKTRAKYLFLTYEGHAWERLVIHEARKINPSIVCVGYQHAVILQRQHAIRRSLNTSYNPDVILCAGGISESQLKNSINDPRVSIHCLGSPKSRVSSNTSFNKLDCCLVVPEGMVSESIILFEFSLRCARTLPNFNFVWRMHPLLSFEKLAKNNDMFKDLPSNISVSNKSLVEDIKRCDTVLYRGSTTVVEAIRVGLKPVYLHILGELSIDPIYQHSMGKFIVTSIDDFEGAIQNPLNEKEVSALCEYAQNYHTPIDYNVLQDVLSIRNT